jgi:hypothetical protein
MHTVDNLFALPAPLALLKTLIRPRGSLFFPILSSLLIHALLLVNVLAPSALTVAPSEQVPRDIEVPIFNLTSQAQFATAEYDIDHGSDVRDLTTMGKERIDSVLLDLPELTRAIPQDCGLKCAFHFEYHAPGLECHDVIPGGGTQDPLISDYMVYQANSNLYWHNVTASLRRQIDVDVPYYLSINYTNITNAFIGNVTISPSAGTYCRFYRATYNASFEFNSNSSTQRASTSIISLGDYLSWGNTGPEATSDEGIASWATCYAFALALQGNFTAGQDVTQIQPVIATILKVNQTTSSSELAVSNLSEALVDLFSNLTLGLLSTRGGQDLVVANATVWDGSSIWIYTTWILLAAYLPAVMLAIAVAIYGLYTIHAGGIAMDDKFSSFLLATQNAKLYEMCGEAADFEELQRLQLVHQEKGTFLVVNSGLKPSD